MQLTAIHTSHVIATYVLETNIPTKLGIYAIYAKYLTYMEDVYLCAIYEVTPINHVTMGTAHIFEIYQ